MVDRLMEAEAEITRLHQERERWIDYTTDLQRIIEALCDRRGLPEPVSTARHHYNMAREHLAAERLAGARVKATSDELSRYIERCRELSDGGEYSWWSRLAEILSALAEPAGEVDPRQFLPTEDGEFNGNTFSDDPVPFGWITQSAYDRVNYSSLPEEVTIIRNAVGPTGMPRVALYTTPPDASAIREALERGQAFANQVRAVTCHLNGQAYSSTVSALNYFDAALSRAALAGAKP